MKCLRGCLLSLLLLLNEVLAVSSAASHFLSLVFNLSDILTVLQDELAGL